MNLKKWLRNEKFIDCKLNENKYCTCINSNFDPFVTKITNITWPPTAAFRMLELGIKSWPRGPRMSNMSLKALRGTLALCWLRWAAKFPANLAIGYHTKFFESWYVCQVDNFDNFDTDTVTSKLSGNFKTIATLKRNPLSTPFHGGSYQPQLSLLASVVSAPLLKVSKFQNEFMKSSFHPKYETKIVRISAL